MAASLEVACHLNRELARGRHDEGLRLARGLAELVVAGLARADGAVQQRDAEAERLARSGLGLADDVVARKRDGEGHRLDGKGNVIPASASASAIRGLMGKSANERSATCTEACVSVMKNPM